MCKLLHIGKDIDKLLLNSRWLLLLLDVAPYFLGLKFPCRWLKCDNVCLLKCDYQQTTGKEPFYFQHFSRRCRRSGGRCGLCCSVQCTVNRVQFTVYSVQCTVFIEQYTIYYVHCTVYSNSVQCTLYPV